MSIRDLVNGFSLILQRYYSQLDNIIERLDNMPLDLKSEMKDAGERLVKLSDDLDEDYDGVSGDSGGGIHSKRKKLAFLGKQVQSLNKNTYSTSDMIEAMNLYLRSRSSYRELRKKLNLPCRNTLYKFFGNIGIPGGLKECGRTLDEVFKSLNNGQKQCFLSFDEISVKASINYQGKYIMGNSFNKAEDPATSMLAVMVNPSFGQPPFVARLVPVHNMDAEFLYEILIEVLEMIHEYGGEVYATMCDDLSVNQKVYKLLHERFGSDSISSIKHPFPNETFKSMFTLYDPVHLVKNIRNNWITERKQELDFKDPTTQVECTAKWNDLVSIYKSEKGCPLTRLNYQTLYPNNFEKQKVYLACNVFNEKTVAALKVRKMNDTALFVDNITKMWNILNVRSTTAGTRLNDPNRMPISDPNDTRLNYLDAMATSFKLMDNSVRGQRVRGLTQETSTALHQTLTGLVQLTRVLLATGHKYVLLGKLQSDPIEKEFGIYRQSSGGNYFISPEQVISSLQLQRLRLFAKLSIDVSADTVDNDCCNYDLFDREEDEQLIDRAFMEASELSVHERSMLFYVSGYVAKKEGLPYSDAEAATDIPECEFTLELSRGGLALPPLLLFDMSLYLYTFFKLRQQKCCTKIFLQAFEAIHVFTEYEFPNIKKINRRFLNTFFKIFCKTSTDNLKAAKKAKRAKSLPNARDVIKRRRISSDS